ncbi:MAG: serine--tRNA ligase [Balneolaceae bacterium]
MLDINTIRNERERVEEGMKAKGEDSSIVAGLIECDTEWRESVTLLEEQRAAANRTAKEIGEFMKAGRKEEAQKAIDASARSKEQLKELEVKIDGLATRREEMLLRIPNLPHESVPLGSSEKDNVVHRTWGEPEEMNWRRPHWELAEENGWIDFERGSKVAGAGFPFYLGTLARLQRSLINFFINEAADKGYTEIQPPYFVNEASARGTGQIPDKEDMMYVIPRDGFYAIPTAEVPVTNFLRDEILPEEELPVRYVAYTPCWRREAGSYGQEVRGLNRLHQFDKVELVKVVHPDDSGNELEKLCGDAEELLRKLNLPYRTLLMCTGDMGFTQSKKYDLEVWSPGQQRWLEVSSCSNFTDYQARRMKLRFRNSEGKTEMAHTLNGSGLALPRVVAAILETYQQKDGSVAVPSVLQPYMGCETV